MSKNKHSISPGPWVNLGDSIIDDATGVAVAVMGGFVGTHKVANFRAVAELPALIEAVREIVDPPRAMTAKNLTKIRATLRAILARIDGE